MKKFLLIVLIVISCGVSGCKMPSTSVRTIDDRPTLAFKNAPDGAILFVDGISMGVASEYDGDPNVLLVEPGTHTIRIMSGSSVIHEQKVFVEGSLKTITIK